jgi:hypothetical protein
MVFARAEPGSEVYNQPLPGREGRIAVACLARSAARQYPGVAKEVYAMPVDQSEMRIVLQVGSELRIKNNGDVIIDNPELELEGQTNAAYAVLLYRFNKKAGEHVLRLVDPVANHKHLKSHRRDD